MQKNYNEYQLKNYAVKTINKKGRINKEQETQIRSPYQRDRDRIIHSSSFRRLKHKTQVFVNTEGDHYRTRLTHSMEVSQISRTLARSLGLNEDLCETLSLSHDLGHTPFGHAGEDVLNSCMKNYGGFDHNIQTLRIVTLLENKYYKLGPGDLVHEGNVVASVDELENGLYTFILFVDSSFRIRSFTRAFTKTFTVGADETDLNELSVAQHLVDACCQNEKSLDNPYVA